MMKISALLAVALISSSVTAFADGAAANAKPVRPATLTCVAATKAADLMDGKKSRELKIEKLDTDQPESVNLDGSLEYIEDKAGVFQIDFNNGCDDDYNFIFFSQDLENLAQGKVKSIPGLLHYFNADTTADPNPTVSVVCK
jgi:hypothetical protein